MGTPVVYQTSSSLPADELIYYMMLPWQDDHLPAAIFKIKIRFLKTSSYCKLIAIATMQIRACPMPISYQQWARNKFHLFLSANFLGKEKSYLSELSELSQRNICFGVIFSSYPKDSKCEYG